VIISTPEFADSWHRMLHLANMSSLQLVSHFSTHYAVHQNSYNQPDAKNQQLNIAFHEVAP